MVAELLRSTHGQEFTAEQGKDEYRGRTVYRGPICHEEGISSYGVVEGGVLFIGISPASDEMRRSKRPLTGMSGQMLNACLEAIGQDRANYYCTNLVCTWMDNPSEQHIEACWSRLKTEIAWLKPKLIVLLGALVTEYFTKRGFSKVRGAVQWSNEFQTYLMGTYHPSAICRSIGEYGSDKDDKASTMIYDFIRDLQKIPDVVQWPEGAPEAQVRYRVVRSREQAQNVLDNLPRNGWPVAIDAETTYSKDDEEVDVFQDTLLCLGIGTDNYCWVLTPEALYNEDGSSALSFPTECNWTMHNSIFDSQVVRRQLGQWITISEDTMLQSYSLDERSGVHRLKTLAREYLGAGFYEDDRFYKKMRLDEIPKSLLYEYNARDVVYTARLCNKLKAKQIEDNVRGFYEQLLIPAVNMYKEAQYHGVNINQNILLKFTWEWGNKILELEDELQEMAQDEGWEGEINLQSPKQLAIFIYKILGLPCSKYTKKGEPSVDREVIEALKDQHPFISKLEQIRRYYKMWGTYILKLPNELKEDGRAHPVVKLHGTATGRPSYTKLAIQTFVATSAPHEFNQMRKLIVPPKFEGYEGTDGYVPPLDDEYVLVEVDYGKAELWTAQSYSNDQQMLLDLLSGDYHTNVAMEIYQKLKILITKDDRTWAKRTSFGILYDIEENTLAKITNSTPYEARERIKRWFKRNFTYFEWFTETQKEIKRTGVLVSKTGRKRRIIILGNAHRAVKQAVNFPIQSTSSDVVLSAAIQMHPKLKEIGSHILFTVHDSIVTKALKSRLAEHCQIMHDIMVAEHFEGMRRIPVEIKAGYSWGDTKLVHDCAEPNTNEFGIDLESTCSWRAYIEQLKIELGLIA